MPEQSQHLSWRRMSSSAFYTPQQGAAERFLLGAWEAMLVCLAQIKSDHPSPQAIITWAVSEVLSRKASNGQLRKKGRERKKKSQTYAFPSLLALWETRNLQVPAPKGLQNPLQAYSRSLPEYSNCHWNSRLQLQHLKVRVGPVVSRE